MLGPAPARMFGQAAAPASGQPQKNWKDRAEYDAFDAITKDTDPKSRLQKLQDWEMKYPMTEFIQERKKAFLTTYAALNDGKGVFATGKQILADDPKDFTAQYYEMVFTIPLYSQNQSPEILDEGDKAAKGVLMSLDTPPPGVAADQWSKLRPQVEVMAHRNLGFIAMQRKNWEEAEGEFSKVLMLTPDDAQSDYWMGTVIASEKKVEKIPTALFYFVRAANIQGQTALAPAAQKAAADYAAKQYKNFHGSDQGFSDVVAAAKTNPMPPAGFAIKNANELAQAAAANEEEYNKSHPAEALWANLKMTLTGSEGESYFNMNMKGSEVPTLKGRVIKLEPALKPKTIMLAMEDKSNNTTTADATLKFEMPLAGKVDEGTELTFEGVPESYTANPFMVVFTVEKEKLHGWTGKNEAAPVHHAPVHRKPAASN